MTKLKTTAQCGRRYTSRPEDPSVRCRLNFINYNEEISYIVCQLKWPVTPLEQVAFMRKQSAGAEHSWLLPSQHASGANVPRERTSPVLSSATGGDSKIRKQSLALESPDRLASRDD